jgi:hypothetical protein
MHPHKESYSIRYIIILLDANTKEKARNAPIPDPAAPA